MPSVPNSLRVILRSWLRPPPLPYTPLLIPQFLISGAALMRSATRTVRRPGEILGRRRRGGGRLPARDRLAGLRHVVNSHDLHPPLQADEGSPQRAGTATLRGRRLRPALHRQTCVEGNGGQVRVECGGCSPITK